MIRKAKFSLGVIVATPGAWHALSALHEDPPHYLGRHVTGDWGELDAQDRRSNEEALRLGHRLLSAYTLVDKETKIWIITEADRSATTILLPDEY